ncbi:MULTISPECIES: T6SS immunity protein Tdi1 domain-containing protein [Ramlibacter]|uniref:DUF1851 domain-containing protein n=1 Tax=Ramlibacter aquaticus TaxID=2780094 RepID=A0ABR9SFD1_9BURK|nr:MULTISPECIES: T6SS immunity protein Tdi1 domain-containing protein [Ramlibacter]MBE7940777.1 DUF1851 domain-containing protein [Ramlibacter aquaticus]
MATWSQLTFDPSPETLAALRKHWAWKLGEDWSPILFSVIGDVFIELPAGSVWWLSTSTGALEQVASQRDEFIRMLETDRADEWFLPGLVDVLHEHGKVPGPDQCYSYAVFPVFAEGGYAAENMTPVAAVEYFGLSGDVHRQIQGLPDGSEVQIRFA